jgi:hypothetical protein
MSGQLHAQAALPPWNELLVLIGWVDPRASLDDVENRTFFTLPGLELRPLGLRVAIPTELSRLIFQRITRHNQRCENLTISRKGEINIDRIVYVGFGADTDRRRRLCEDNHSSSSSGNCSCCVPLELPLCYNLLRLPTLSLGGSD